MEKCGGGGCCNTATYSTGEEALAVDGERGNNYTNNYAIIKFFLEIILEIICTLLNKRVNLYRGVFFIFPL